MIYAKNLASSTKCDCLRAIPGNNPMRFEALNVFRFIAALIIVIFHFQFPFIIIYKNVNLTIPGFFFDGPDMVTFFFVLSGFVMTISYYSKESLDRNYWLNRISRIYPVYFFALLLTIAAFGISKMDFALILNLTLLQSWFPQYALAINGPAWALSVEAFFYVSFPLILFYLKRKEYNPLKVISAAVLFWLLTQIILTILLNSRFYKGVGSYSHEYIFHFPLPHLCSFILGIAGGYLIIKNQQLLQLPKFISYSCVILTSIGGFFLVGSMGMIQRLIGFRIPTGASLLGPLFLIFILSIVAISDTSASRFLSNRLFILLGAASYALYILQLPINNLLYRFVLPLPSLGEGMNLILFIFINIILSIIAFYIIEKPGQIMVKTLFKRGT